MNSLLRIIVTTVAVTAVFSKQIDTRPRIDDDETTVTKKTPTRYVAEEVVIYLTPSQLQAIQEGKGFIDSEPLTTTEASLESQDGAESDQLEEDGNPQSQSDGSDTEISREDEDKVASSLSDEEQNSEEIDNERQLSRTYTGNQKNIITLPDDLFTLLKNYQEAESQTAKPAEPETESENISEGPNIDSDSPQADTRQGQRYKLVPYESATEASKPRSTEPTVNDPLRERWLQILEQSRIQLRTALLEQDLDTTTTTTTSTTTTEQPKTKSESTLAKLRYSSKYRFKNQTNQYKGQENNINLEKQKLTKTVPRVNDVVRKEVKKLNQQQKSLVKQVRVHSPVFIPIPESAKIPINSPIAFKGLKPVSIQANKAVTKNKVQKNPESQVRARGTEPKTILPKNISVEANNTLVESRSTSDAGKEAPVEINLRQKGKPERITIIRHVIDN